MSEVHHVSALKLRTGTLTVGPHSFTGRVRSNTVQPHQGEEHYRGTSLTRQRNPLGTYRRPMPRVLEGVPRGVGVFL